MDTDFRWPLNTMVIHRDIRVDTISRLLTILTRVRSLHNKFGDIRYAMLILGNGAGSSSPFLFIFEEAETC